MNPVPNEDLAAFTKELFLSGCDRVVINAEGEGKRPTAITPTPDIIFIRKDGWSLGAPSEFESVAYKLWADEWIGFVRKPNYTAVAISEYKPS